MKTIPEILATINVKIKEHTDIVEQVDQDIKTLSKSADAQNQIVLAQKKLVLKDKILFHRAAILTLKDIQDSING